MVRMGVSMKERLCKQSWKGKENMKRKIKRLATLVMTLMLMTPVFTTPKIPVIPNISGSVTLPAGAQEAAKKAGQEAVKKIDWSNFDFSLILKRDE